MSYYIRNDPPVGTYSNPSILTSSSVRPIRIHDDDSTGFASSLIAHGYHPGPSYVSGNILRPDARPGRSYVERHGPSAGHSYIPSRAAASSYLPPPDANLMQDYICCEVRLPTLADLLEHYEEHHASGKETKQDANDTPSHDPANYSTSLNKPSYLVESEFEHNSVMEPESSRPQNLWPLDSSDSESEPSSPPLLPPKAVTPPALPQLPTTLMAPYPQVESTAMQAAMVAMGQHAPTIPKDDAPRPFKCPVNGCSRAYKTQNGLRYHKSVSRMPDAHLVISNAVKHSHNHQHLRENSDGTFEVVGPARRES
jgi:hypothetical protein